MPSPRMLDPGLSVSVALPDGAVTEVSIASIDMGPKTPNGNRFPEFLLAAPVLSTIELPDGETIDFDIIASSNSDLSSPVVVMKAAITQTGAGGIGAAAAETRFDPASTCPRYLGLEATGSAGVSAPSKKATLTYVV